MAEIQTIERSLLRRGVNPELAAWFPVCLEAGVIERTLAWYDRQQGRVGPGVLVAELRRGGHQPRGSSSADQRAYLEQIRDWLAEHMPELCQQRGSPHPAAIVAVIHLHARHGKQALSVAEHGPQIRAAVERFDSREQDGR